MPPGSIASSMSARAGCSASSSSGSCGPRSSCMHDARVAPALSPLASRLAYGTAIAGLGTALPQTVVTNADVAARIGKDEPWIVQRTGIYERRVLRPEERLAEL